MRGTQGKSAAESLAVMVYAAGLLPLLNMVPGPAERRAIKQRANIKMSARSCTPSPRSDRRPSGGRPASGGGWGGGVSDEEGQVHVVCQALSGEEDKVDEDAEG